MNDSLKADDKFDFIFTDRGMVEIVTGSSSIANMLSLDFVSNNDWDLDSDLGINWINTRNNGLLQVKSSEVLIVKEIQRKLESRDGVREVKQIQINRRLNRSLSIVVTVVVTDGTEFELRNEVL